MARSQVTNTAECQGLNSDGLRSSSGGRRQERKLVPSFDDDGKRKGSNVATLSTGGHRVSKSDKDGSAGRHIPDPSQTDSRRSAATSSGSSNLGTMTTTARGQAASASAAVEQKADSSAAAAAVAQHISLEDEIDEDEEQDGLFGAHQADDMLLDMMARLTGVFGRNKGRVFLPFALFDFRS